MWLETDRLAGPVRVLTCKETSVQRSKRELLAVSFVQRHLKSQRRRGWEATLVRQLLVGGLLLARWR